MHSSSPVIDAPKQHIKNPETMPLTILLVEDVASEALLTRRALDKTKLPYNLFTLSKGAQVMPYLSKYHFDRFQKEANVSLPDVILLDLGLPGVNGFDILESMATANGSIRSVPVIILSGYRHFDYLCKTNDLWIPAYLPKPCDPFRLRELLEAIKRRRFKA